MNKSLLLSISAALILTGCDRANPVEPTPDTPIVDEMGVYAKRLEAFHNTRDTSDHASWDNASKTSPTDSILLLPPGVPVPAGLSMLWWHTDDGVQHRVDPSSPTRVPLQDGIVIHFEGGRGEHVQHSASATFDAPLIGPASGAMDFFVDSVLIASSRPGVEIHYTLDGSYPTIRSPFFEGRIPLDRPYLVRAIGVIPGQGTSLSRSAAFSAAQGWNPYIHYDTLVDARDGQSYPTLHLGNQTWMAKNLNWSAPGGSLRDSREGALYTTDQVLAGGLCPEGWSVPSRADWDSLVAWGIRQPGVTKDNFGNALRSTALYTGWRPPETVNHVDLFGFRATSASFWTRTPGHDSGTVVLRTFSEGSFVESIQEAMSTRWIYNYGQEAYSISTPTTSRVRCLKDAP
jgi:uncharacterized protein (TIGR02145 family)